MAKIHQLRNVLQLNISLKGTKPKIYRTILLEDDRTFSELHHIIQIAMGWENYHLYQFIAGKHIIGDPSLLEDDSTLDSNTLKIKQILFEVGSKIKYEYDFGDSWEHTIKLEKILPIKLSESYPTCIRGNRNCPPEDCGGIWGYLNLIEIMEDKNHHEYEDMINWLGDEYIPEEFDLEIINEELKYLDDYMSDSMYAPDE